MTPCEDIKTIHASQNDSEAREWGFELHNNGEKIDSSAISDQLVFKAYKGGTEEILPENGSTPTTSPFKGDIKYLQGLLSDQEFTYRQSPTEEDGLAFVEKIKGNTLAWNQLVQNGNFADTSLWRTYASTGFSVSNNVGSFTVTGATGAIYQTNTPTYVSGHKYLVIADFYVSQQTNISVEVSGTRGQAVSVNANTWYRYSDIVTPSAQGNFSLTCGQASVQVKNVMCFDITQMGLDITDPSEFTSLFPLSYYAYNQGTLLSFMGNGIKTVGFNQWDEEWEHGSLGNNGENTGSSASPEIRSTNYIPIVQNASYYLNVPAVAVVHYYGSADLSNYKGNQYIASAQLLNIPNGTNYIRFRTIGSYGDYKNDICLNISDPNRNGIYEPYTESTISIPLDEFPNGMDGTGDVHDEKDETGYVKRFATIKVDTVASGSPRNNGDYYAAVNGVTNAKPADNGTVANMICNICETMSAGARYNSTKSAVCARTTGSIELCISGITSRADLQTYVDSHDIYITYELATPLENYGIVDLGSLNWNYNSTNAYFTTNDISSLYKVPSSNLTVANIICPIHTTISANDLVSAGQLGIAIRSNGTLMVKDTNYTDATAFKQAMSGVHLLYEKENPQGFTTATLVTENGEVALANENGVLVGKCNSDVSADAGFIEGKIKLSDEDGDVYSNKIQIHVERSPQ